MSGARGTARGSHSEHACACPPPHTHRSTQRPASRARARTSPRSRVQASLPRSSGRQAPGTDAPTHHASHLSLPRSDLVWAQSCTISTVTRVLLIGRLPRRQGVWSVGLVSRLGAPRPGRSHLLTTATNESLAW